MSAHLNGSEDDIQILYEHPSSGLKCELCSRDLQSMTVEKRQEHYETHFSNEAGSSSTGARKLNAADQPKPSSPLKRKRQDNDDKDVFWHPSEATPPPVNFTPGIIPILNKALLKSHAKRNTQKAYLCCDRAVHVVSQSWDRGWGCGYRNFEMACAALVEEPRQPEYFPLLDEPIAPGVRRLQTWLEHAWHEGYDEEGAEHFKHQLVGTKKWIGTADLYVAFASRGIPATLVDFDLSNRGRDTLIQWIVTHFTQDPPKQTNVNDALRGAAPVVITDRLPIILQHSGHSRTVIGYEKLQNGSINLLMFDPSKTIPSKLRQIALNAHLAASGEAPSPSSSKSKHSLSPKKLMNRVLHPNKIRSNADDKGIFTHKNGPSVKRARPETEPEVIVIDDDDEATIESKPKSVANSPDEESLHEMLKLLRIPSSYLRKDKYQILFFPVTDPLDEAERRRRRVVTSMKVS